MQAMQYAITLPADYDMQIIRKRVADFGHLLDDRAGLGLKAYLIRERGRHGSPVNQYAPFYLWNDIGAMSRFLVGNGGFQNIIRDFGRPVVQHWTGIADQSGRATVPTMASRRVTAVPDGGDSESALAERIQQEIDDLGLMLDREDVYRAAVAIDPYHWRLVRFVLWRDTVPEEEQATECYEVLHLSAPGVRDLPGARHW